MGDLVREIASSFQRKINIDAMTSNDEKPPPGEFEPALLPAPLRLEGWEVEGGKEVCP